MLTRVLSRLSHIKSYWYVRRAGLLPEIHDYMKRSKSTGCKYTTIEKLYRNILKTKPQYILECGTGLTTVIIAKALQEIKKTTGVHGKVISMEEHQTYLEMSQDLLPPKYAEFVEFKLSDTIEDQYSFFRGMRYSDIPQYNYDFVFIDGPSYLTKTDKSLTFDFDFLHIVKNSNKEVTAVIDTRVSTCFVLQTLLGPSKVKYSTFARVGCVSGVSAKNLGNIQSKLSSTNFKKTKPLFSRPRIVLNKTTT